MNSITRRQRRLLWTALAWLVLALVLLAVFHAPSGAARGPGPLELAQTAQEFRAALLHDWAQAPEPETGTPTCGIGAAYLPDIGNETPTFGRLRCNLFVDSIGLVPAYVAVLLFLTLALGPSRPWLRQVLCVPAVAAGLFDIAENSMLAGALDDLLQSSLADATVADVTHASQAKWILLGLALAVLAYRAANASAQDRPWNSVSAVACAVAAVAFGIGGATACHGATGVGMGVMSLGLGLLVCRALRLTPGSPDASAGAG